MDLKEFVRDTLVEITEGIKEAQVQCQELGGLVNPMLKVRTCNKPTYMHDDGDYPATEVKFNVGLTETDRAGGKTGIGVFLKPVSLGKENEKETETQSITSVQFSVTVVFPYLGREGKHIPLGSIFP